MYIYRERGGVKNRMLRGILRPKAEEVAGGWRTMRLHSSPSIIRMTKSRRTNFSKKI
jgi:hypothetical protein